MTGMHQHDGYEPHSHEVRADHRGITRERAELDSEALNQIADLLEHDYSPGQRDAIAEIVRLTGREIRDAEPDDVACGQADETGEDSER